MAGRAGSNARPRDAPGAGLYGARVLGLGSVEPRGVDRRARFGLDGLGSPGPLPDLRAPAHYMASPGDSTPFRPLLSGMIRAAARRAFLRQFGFTKRDIVRIKALAAEVTQTYQPAALNDLDVAFRVGAHTRESAARCSGEPLGEWDGRVLVYWPMLGRELDRWRSRRPGPRKVP